jgi:hypothetical protein
MIALAWIAFALVVMPPVVGLGLFAAMLPHLDRGGNL